MYGDLKTSLYLYLFLYTSQMGAINHSSTNLLVFFGFLYPQDLFHTSHDGAMNLFQYNMLAKCMALSNLLVYLIFISTYKPYGRYKSQQYFMSAKVWLSKTYWFILFFLFLYTSRMGAINHFNTICSSKYGAPKLICLIYFLSPQDVV